MSRRRTQADSDVVAATIRVISRIGPARFTLADVAQECKLAPATLLQRFGSKRGLLLAVAGQSAATVDVCFKEVRSRAASPLGAIYAALDEMTRHAQTPEEMANSLAFLEIDLTDPDFHRLALRSSKAIIAGYRRLINEAIAARELISCDSARLAHSIQALANGSMLEWAIHRDGPLNEWLRNDVETLLEPFRVRKKHRSRVASPRRSRLSQRA